MTARWIVWPLLVVAVGAAVATHRSGVWRWPDRWNPWAPLAIAEAPNALTRFKLARLSRDGDACRAVLATTGFAFTPLPDRDTDAGCVLRDAVLVRRSGVDLGAPVTLSCPAAVSLALWERHALQPAAELFLGAPVRRIEHYGSLACRNVYGRETGRRSRHASADAFDVAGFVAANGKRVTVRRDWGSADAEARFLEAVHRGACRYYDGVLGPGYNRAHADHFHFDRGPARICR